ncbi:hypothetical protein [Paenibacillus thalictri]|uniref:Uncharacterized protein n=1 Tax=Paenibacillus thalictri TaxID=2527873 RepID=A0A4Q9DF15_9BACL|nr:hypothetical protein [Paenibacillus thalictri]TBL68499.1 hypothetical protein EYB31_38025 [Paenibacillus thalictri]
MSSFRMQTESSATEYIIVSAPNRAGKEFLSLLREKGENFLAITNNKYGKKRLEAMGVDQILMVNTEDDRTWGAPDIRVGEVYLFELSFNLCCRYIQICKKWNPRSIHVITKRGNTRVAYRGLGANQLTYINNNEVEFLLT